MKKTLEQEIFELLPYSTSNKIAAAAGVSVPTVVAVRKGKFKNEKVRQAYLDELRDVKTKIDRLLKEYKNE